MSLPSILIVEDEAIVALDISLILKKEGYKINRICHSSDKLFSDIKNYPKPDLILMDIHIKGSLDGTEAALKIKKLYNIPVIFLTAYTDKDTVEKAKNSYPYGYIVKPYDKRKFLIDIEMGLNIINLEKKIRSREELFSATINSIADAVIITDDKNLIKYMNPVAKSMIVNPEVLDEKFESVFNIDFDIELNRGLFKDKYGKLKTIEIKKTELDHRHVRGSGYVWILTDITISVFLETQLREAQKMEAVGRLAGGIAHDFNNLLTVIMGYCSLILDNTDLMDHNAGLKNDISGIQVTSQKAVKLTKQLLTFTINQVHYPRLVDLNSVIKDLKKIFDRLIPDEIKLTYYLTDDKTIINVDPVQIEQVLINLIINSRDAIGESGEIKIETSVIESSVISKSPIRLPEGEYLLLSIKDNGCGIPESLKSKIFEPFFSTKTEGKGLGLGLSTVYGIVKHSGGFIDVESSPAYGSSFNLYFPHVKSEIPAMISAIKSRISDMGKETILIVEEDEFVCSIMSRILDSKGYFVIEARSAGEALLLCENREKPIKLIITDLFMPLISGRELVERILSFFPDIKILFTSTHNFESINDKHFFQETNNFIQKPFDPDDFSLLVRKSLDSN